MPRVKLSPCDHYPWTITLDARVSDINYGGHMSNDALVALIHHARLALLKELGCSELDLGDGQTGTIMTDLAVNYLAEAFVFDELVINSGVSEVSSRGFRLCHRVTREGEPIALVECGFLPFDYGSHKRGRVPAATLAKLQAAASPQC